MTDYTMYMSMKNLSNNDVIRAVRSEFPGYSKIQHSMVSNPAKYGVCLLPEAEAEIVRRFGKGLGLTISYLKTTCEEEPKTEPAKHKPSRKKPNRLVVYLDDELNNRVKDLMYELHFNTVQGFLEAALSSMVEQKAQEGT